MQARKKKMQKMHNYIITILITSLLFTGCGAIKQKNAASEKAFVEVTEKTETDTKYELSEPETEASIETDNYNSYSQLNKMINKITDETKN